MELLARARQLREQRRRLVAAEALALALDLRAQLGEPLDDLAEPARIGVTQHAAAERGEAGAEDRGEVERARPVDDLLGEAARGLVGHREHAAVDDLVRAHRAQRTAREARADAVLLQLAALARAPREDALRGLLAELLRLDQRLQELRRAHALAVGLLERRAGVRGDVEPDLVD